MGLANVKEASVRFAASLGSLNGFPSVGLKAVIGDLGT